MAEINILSTLNFVSEDINKKSSEEIAEEKNLKNLEKHIASVANIVKNHEEQPLLYLKASKIKEVIGGFLLNPESEQAKDELKGTRMLTNIEEKKDFLARKTAFDEENKTTSEKWAEKFIPAYEYRFQSLSNPTKNKIQEAIKNEKFQHAEKYARSVVKLWKEVEPSKFEEFQALKKSAGDNISYVELLSKFSKKAMDTMPKHVFEIKYKNGTESVVERYDVPTKIPEDKRFLVYKNMLTKGNVRFSKSSQMFISFFLEDVARQIAFNCLFHARQLGDSCIKARNLYLAIDSDFLNKYVPLHNLINFTKAYSEISNNKFEKEKKVRQKKSERSEEGETAPILLIQDKLPKKQSKDAMKNLPILERVVQTLSQDHYAKSQIGNNCKCDLALDLEEGPESPYYKIKYTQSYVLFISNMLGEITYKLGLILKSQIRAYKSKTINIEMVQTAIEHLLIALNVETVTIDKTVKSLQVKFASFEQKKAEEKKTSSKKDNVVAATSEWSI